MIKSSLKRKLWEQLSEIPCLVSSDLHEWCNDCPAVSNMASVKLNSPCRCGVPEERR